MRLAGWIAFALTPLPGQIAQPPEFQDKGTFQTSGGARQVDGTTHVSADRAETNARLAELLRGYPAAGPAVEKYLSGDLAGSAAALLALPAGLQVLPFLGETVAASPSLLPRLREIAKSNPNDAGAAYYLGRALALPGSVPYLRQAASLEPKNARALVELGRQFANDGKRAEAIAAFESALEREPDSKTAHFRLAQLYRAVGNAEKSREHLRQYQKGR